MKGILAIQGESQKYQYHAVHMIFNGTFTEEWGPDEQHYCKLIFIGKNLDHEELRSNFYACMENEENWQKRVSCLRFDIGDLVECRNGSGQADWLVGKVKDRLFRGASGDMVPYQIELMDGTITYVMADDNQLIRANDVQPVASSSKGANAYWDD